jgi:hypothetical protein
MSLAATSLATHPYGWANRLARGRIPAGKLPTQVFRRSSAPRTLFFQRLKVHRAESR